MNTNAIATRPVRVICLGEILFDCLADELGKSLSEVSSWTPYPGGAPANVASALVKLGTPAAFIGCVGKDTQGRELVQLLQSIGVNLFGVQYNSQVPTRQVYVTRSDNGDRTFAGFGERPRVLKDISKCIPSGTPSDIADSPKGKTSASRLRRMRELGEQKADQFADAYLQAKYLPPSLFLSAEYLVLGTLELAYPHSRAAVFRALELAEEYHLKIVLDVNWRPMFWLDQSQALPLIKELWQHIDFLKLAEEEAQWLFNTADAGAISHNLGSVEGVLVSNGDAAVSYCINDHEGTVEPLKVAVQDTTGAGDAFLAGFIHQLCVQGTPKLNDPQVVREIVSYACAVGGLTTTKPGAIAAQPTPSEVEALLG